MNNNSLSAPFVSRAAVALMSVGMLAYSFFMPLAALAAASVTIDTINGVPPAGHCIAGALTIVVHGTRGTNGGPYSVVAGNGFSTSSPVSVGSGANGAFSNITISYTPSGASTNLYVNLFHGSQSGNDSHITVINQCIAPPTTAVVTIQKAVSGGSAVPGDFTLHFKNGANAEVVSNGNGVTSPFVGSIVGSDFIVPVGTYTMSENAALNYTPSFGGSAACLSTGAITTVAGTNYTCVVTNTYTPPAPA